MPGQHFTLLSNANSVALSQIRMLQILSQHAYYLCLLYKFILILFFFQCNTFSGINVQEADTNAQAESHQCTGWITQVPWLNHTSARSESHQCADWITPMPWLNHIIVQIVPRHCVRLNHTNARLNLTNVQAELHNVQVESHQCACWISPIHGLNHTNGGLNLSNP